MYDPYAALDKKHYGKVNRPSEADFWIGVLAGMFVGALVALVVITSLT